MAQEKHKIAMFTSQLARQQCPDLPYTAWLNVFETGFTMNRTTHKKVLLQTYNLNLFILNALICLFSVRRS